MQLAYFRSVFTMAAAVCPSLPWTTPAEVLLLTIAGQESGWNSRTQFGGPAHSYWQFDPDTVTLLQNNPVTGPILNTVCEALDISQGDIFTAMTWNDVLAMIMARLLLWANPNALPLAGNPTEAYGYYIATWEPGDPRPDSWPALYAEVMAVVTT